MKSLIKKVLLEYVQGMDEVELGPHGDERLRWRVTETEPVDVVFEYFDKASNRYRRKFVGKYTFTKDVIDGYLRQISELRGVDIDECCAVILGKARLDGTTIDFTINIDEKLEYYNMMQGGNGQFYLNKKNPEPTGFSQGDFIVAVIDINKIITIEYVKERDKDNTSHYYTENCPNGVGEVYSFDFAIKKFTKKS